MVTTHDSLHITESEQHQSFLEYNLLQPFSSVAFIIDKNGIFLNAIFSSADILFASPESFIGESIREIFGANLSDFFTSTIDQCLRTQSIQVRVYSLNVQGSEKLFIAQVLPYGTDQILWLARDVSAFEQIEKKNLIQMEITNRINECATLDEILKTILQTAIHASNMDCGGIYIFNSISKIFELSYSENLSPDFIKTAQSYNLSSDRYKLIETGNVIFDNYDQLALKRNQILDKEGLRSVAILPIIRQGKLIASINIGSHQIETITNEKKQILTTLANQASAHIQQKQIQLEVAEQELNEFQSILESLQDFVFVINSQQKIIYANQLVYEELDYAPDELLGKNVLFVHPEEDHKTAQQIVKKMIAGVEDTCPLSLRTRTGKKIPVETKVKLGMWKGEEVIIGISRDITLRLQTETRLRERELFFQMLFNENPIPIMMADRSNYQILAANDALCTFFACSKDQLQQTTFIQMLQDDDQPAFVGLLNLLPQSMSHMGEWEIETMAGAKKHIAVTIKPLDFQNNPTLLLIIQDVTEQHRSQQELMKAQERLYFALDAVNDGLWDLKLETGEVFTSQRWKEMLGYAEHEISPDINFWRNAVHPDDIKSTLQILQDHLDGKTAAYNTEYRLRCKDGSYKWILDRGKVIARAQNGKPLRMIGTHTDIDQRKQVEEALAVSEAQYKAIVEDQSELICRLDGNGKIIFVNEAYCRFFNRSCVEIISGFFAPVMQQEDLAYFESQIAKLSPHIPIIEYENRVILEDSTIRWLHWRDHAIFDQNGELLQIQSVGRDITDYKKALCDLNYRLQFEDLVARISTRLINFSNEEMNQQINLALQEIGEFSELDRSYIFYFDPAKLTMSNSHEWCAPGIRPAIDMLQKIPVKLMPWWMEKLNNREVIYIPDVSQMGPESQTEKETLEQQDIKSVLVVPMVYQNQLMGFIGFDSVREFKSWDVNIIALLRMVGDSIASAIERVCTNERLYDNEKRNRALLKAIPDVMFRVNAKGTIIDFAPGTAMLMKLFKTSIIPGKTIAEVFPKSTLAYISDGIKKALIDQKLFTFDFNLQKRSTHYNVEARVLASGDDEVIIVLQDITQRKQLEQMKTDFINHATHEIRTPITTILLMIDLIEKTDNDQKKSKYWDILKNEIAREWSLIEDLLTVGRVEQGRLNITLKLVDYSSILRKSIEIIRPLANDKTIHLNFQCDAPDIRILGDESSLNQVFLNLLSNAIKFTPEGGKIDVMTSVEEVKVITCIQDNGIGIPKKDIPFLFTRFFRANNAVQNEIPGSGIGLFIVDSLIRKMKGSIEAKSEINKGTIFTIRFPLLNGN